MSIINDNNTPYIGWNSEISIRDVTVLPQLRKFNDAQYFCVDFMLGDGLEHLNKVVPSSILISIRRGRIKLILNNSHEAFHSVVDGVYKFVVIKFKIPEEQILLLSESADIKNEIDIVAKKYNCKPIAAEWSRVFEISTKNDITSMGYVFPDTLKTKNYPKKFLNLNRRWRLHRPALVAFLTARNLLDYGHVSLASSDDNRDWNKVWTDILDIHRNHYTELELLKNNEDKILSLPELFVDRTDMEINHVNLLQSTTKFYEETYFSVVSETNYYDFLEKGRFLSEKLFKPIANFHPFIIVSRPRSLEAIRSIGYKTFHPYINEAYDLIEDDVKRMIAVVDEIERLSKLNTTELAEFLDFSRSVCKYNFDMLLSKSTFTTQL